MTQQEHSAQRLVEAVRQARVDGRRLQVRGQNSKRGWLADVDGEFLETLEHTGILTYDPSELVVTARAGTPLRDLCAELAHAGQVLAFDPPQFFDSGTVGGMVSAGLSGPARPWCGSTSGAVLGVELINGQGDQLTFGGQVMKNVAGYDVSRLATGAWGALGVVLQASIRVQPVREHLLTLGFELDARAANDMCRALARRYLPVTGSWWVDGVLNLRLAGSEAGVLAAQAELGGEVCTAGKLWEDIRDHTHGFFRARIESPEATGLKLWRVVVPPAAGLPEIPHERLALEWAGGQRWLWHDQPEEVLAYARVHKGWAWAMGEPYVLEPLERQYMSAVKRAFDPDDTFATPLQLSDDAH